MSGASRVAHREWHVQWILLELEMHYQEGEKHGPLTMSTSVRVCVPDIKTLYLHRNGCKFYNTMSV